MSKDIAIEAALTALRYDPNAYGYREIADIAIKACEEALKEPEEIKVPERGFWFYEN